MSRIVIGIDPGHSGGLVAVNENSIVDLIDMPNRKVKYMNKTRQEVDGLELYNWFTKIKEASNDILVCIEEIHARPHQNCASVFTFGRGVGSYESILHAVQLDNKVYVPPQTWQAYHKKNGGKDVSVSLAQVLAGDQSNLITNDGRAEAYLIALYGRSTN